MPEGDTLFRVARTLDRALGGERITGFRSAVPHFAFVELGGRVVLEVESRGKHLLMHLDGDEVLLSHLRMQGAWHLYRPDERWQRPSRDMRLVIETAPFAAVCFSAPTIELWDRRELERAGPVAGLGPDLIRDEVDLGAVAARMKALGERSVGEVLMHQGLVAGIGNVYKSEVCFLERQDPFQPVERVPVEKLTALLSTARGLMRQNLAGEPRRTRPSLSGPRLWVYERGGAPCLVCGARVERRVHGDPPRSTYSCPRCQSTAPTTESAARARSPRGSWPPPWRPRR